MMSVGRNEKSKHLPEARLLLAADETPGCRIKAHSDATNQQGSAKCWYGTSVEDAGKIASHNHSVHSVCLCYCETELEEVITHKRTYAHPSTGFRTRGASPCD